MEFFVALVLFFIIFTMASGVLAVGMAVGYLVLFGMLPWWVIFPVMAAVIWWLGAERVDN